MNTKHLDMNYQLLAEVGLPKPLFDSGRLDANVLYVKRGETIFSPGDQCGAFLLLVSGSLRVDMTSRSGREILLYRMKEKETCILTTSALLNDENYYACAIAESDITAIALPTAEFFKALSLSAEFSHFVLRDYSSRISSLISLIDRIASRDVAFDICSLLLNRYDTNNIVFMTQENIAKEIGSAREVVSRKLSVLEQSGLLKCQRGKIQLLDLHKIQEKIEV